MDAERNSRHVDRTDWTEEYHELYENALALLDGKTSLIVEKLAELKVGRPIVIEMDGRKEVRGVVLPTEEIGLEHIIIMKDGPMAVIRPGEGEVNRQRYTGQFSETAPIKFMDESSDTEIIQIIGCSEYIYGSVTVFRNINEEEIRKRIIAARELIPVLGQQRARALRETVSFFNEKMGDLLGPSQST